MDIATFQNLPTSEIARLVRESGSKVCVFPVNGTRRWFVLEHEPSSSEDWVNTYLDVARRRHIELYQMFFERGVGTLLSPVFGPDLLERGEAYLAMAVEGLAQLATHPDFMAFYSRYQVRVRFYGDYRDFFADTPYAYLVDLFDRATTQTIEHDRHRLFFGVCAQDATETVAKLAVQHYTKHSRVPGKRELIEAYYGEFVEPVDLFIGFGKFCAFDMPLLETGEQDLYFTVSPSPYLTEAQLAAILYDHLMSRKEADTDYAALSAEDWAQMKAFYYLNLGKTQGVGAQSRRGRFWYPTPQVQLLAGWEG